MSLRVRAKNSTIVRTQKSQRPAPRPRRPALAVAAARLGLRMLAPTAPTLAAACAERLFLTAPRHRRQAWEEEILASAESFQIPHQDSFLPAWRWGSAASTVLLVHGWEGRGSQLGAFVAPLLAEGLSVVAFDAPGHGDAPTRTASLVEHARAVASAGAHLGRLHGVIGHSVGGASTLYATRLGLRADRLALVSPPMSPDRFSAGFAKLLDLQPELLSAMFARLESRYGVRIDDLDVRADAERYAPPLLVVHDDEDRVVPMSDGASLAKAAPQGQLISTSGLGHNRILRAQSVLDAVVLFMASGDRAPTFSATLEGDLFFRYAR